MRITRVSPVSVAKVAFVLYAVLGLIIGGVMACAALLGATLGPAHGRRLRGLRCDLRRRRGDLHASAVWRLRRARRAHRQRDLQPRRRIRGRYRGDASSRSRRPADAKAHRAAHGGRRRRQQAEADRGIRGPRELGARGRQRRADGVAGGWVEPGQRPEFEEITVVLRGRLRVEHEGGALDVAAGQAVVTAPGEWVRYSTPGRRRRGIRGRVPAGVFARDSAP